MYNLMALAVISQYNMCYLSSHRYQWRLARRIVTKIGVGCGSGSEIRNMQPDDDCVLINEN